jgi:outer membrane protein OmpA-like peptidoglycan-associated protein
MKLIVSRPRAVAALVVGSAVMTACASSQKELTAPQQAAAQAEEQAQKAQNDAQKARVEADKRGKDLAEAQQTHDQARSAELMADQRATEASRRAAIAEAQAGLAARPAATPPAPAAQAQAGAPAQAGPQKSEKGVAEAQGPAKVTVITTSLLFKTGSAELSSSAKSQLDDVAKALSAEPQANNVKVQGYTDDVGSSAVNDPLSMKRAEAVSGYLQSQGVPKDRISAKGFGVKDPVSTANTTEGRALNRRVDVVIEPVEGRAMPQGQPQHEGQPQHGQPSQPPPSQPPPSQP